MKLTAEHGVYAARHGATASWEAWDSRGAAAVGAAGDEASEGAWGVVLGRALLLIVRLARG